MFIVISLIIVELRFLKYFLKRSQIYMHFIKYFIEIRSEKRSPTCAALSWNKNFLQFKYRLCIVLIQIHGFVISDPLLYAKNELSYINLLRIFKRKISVSTFI